LSIEGKTKVLSCFWDALLQRDEYFSQKMRLQAIVNLCVLCFICLPPSNRAAKFFRKIQGLAGYIYRKMHLFYSTNGGMARACLPTGMDGSLSLCLF
jgi:hypothetical protein